MFEFVKKVANGANESIENGTHELSKAAEALARISLRHERMREIAAEVGTLLIDASEYLDAATVKALMSGRLLFEVLEDLRQIDGERISSLSAKASEAEVAIKAVPDELSSHGPVIRRTFDTAFFVETQEAFQEFDERTAEAADVIEAATSHQVTAVEACRQSLENL